MNVQNIPTRQMTVGTEYVPVGRTPMKFSVIGPGAVVDIKVGDDPPLLGVQSYNCPMDLDDPRHLLVSARSSGAMPTCYVQWEERETTKSIELALREAKEARVAFEGARIEAERRARAHVIASRKGQIERALIAMGKFKHGVPVPDEARWNVVQDAATRQWRCEELERTLGVLPPGREPIYWARALKALGANERDLVALWRRGDGTRLAQVAEVRDALAYCETQYVVSPFDGAPVKSGIRMF